MANPLKMLKLKPTGFQFIHETPIKAPPQKVWNTLIHPETWFFFENEDPGKQSFDPSAGGRWIVENEGIASFMGTVTHVETGKLLRLSGPMGLSHLPVSNVFVYELQPGKDGKSTLLRTGQRTFGFLTPSVKKDYSGGWKQLMAKVKAVAEK